jgi:hypothetical protein
MGHTGGGLEVLELGLEILEVGLEGGLAPLPVCEVLLLLGPFGRASRESVKLLQEEGDLGGGLLDL